MFMVPNPKNNGKFLNDTGVYVHAWNLNDINMILLWADKSRGFRRQSLRKKIMPKKRHPLESNPIQQCKVIKINECVATTQSMLKIHLKIVSVWSACKDIHAHVLRCISQIMQKLCAHLLILMKSVKHSLSTSLILNWFSIRACLNMIVLSGLKLFGDNSSRT